MAVSDRCGTWIGAGQCSKQLGNPHPTPLLHLHLCLANLNWAPSPPSPSLAGVAPAHKVLHAGKVEAELLGSIAPSNHELHCTSQHFNRSERTSRTISFSGTGLHMWPIMCPLGMCVPCNPKLRTGPPTFFTRGSLVLLCEGRALQHSSHVDLSFCLANTSLQPSPPPAEACSNQPPM